MPTLPLWPTWLVSSACPDQAQACHFHQKRRLSLEGPISVHVRRISLWTRLLCAVMLKGRFISRHIDATACPGGWWCISRARRKKRNNSLASSHGRFAHCHQQHGDTRLIVHDRSCPCSLLYGRALSPLSTEPPMGEGLSTPSLPLA